MSHAEASRARPRRRSNALVVGLLVAVSAIATAIGYPGLSSSTAAPAIDDRRDMRPGKPAERPSRHVDRPGPRGDVRAALGQAEGVVPDGTTVFDGVPGVANLDPDLLDALRRAARDAAAEGVVIFVESGWRSPAYQDRLLRDAVAEYGSVANAARWVATPTTSAHVSGDAVDIGPVGATAWLSEHGAEYGLCQIFRNEPWHYEFRARAIGGQCPRMYSDPSHHPRAER